MASHDRMESFAVTVIIPTFNGERYLARVLDAIKKQRYEGSVETFVIDSGSTDGTLDIVRAREWVRLHEIPNAEFGHGRTRNLAAQLARGRLLAYITQDAIPIGDRWLADLTAPLDPNGLDAVAVVGKQIPRASCFPLLKYEIQATFKRLGPQHTASVVDANSTTIPPDAIAFYSDVNSATRRSFLVDTLPYRDVSYSEDFAFAEDLLAAGHRKAYSPCGAVEHSNDLTLREYGARIFDEAMGLRRVGRGLPRAGRFGWLAHAAVGALRDAPKIMRDPDYLVRQRIHWLVANPAFHFLKWRSYRRANRVHLDDLISNAKWSLEQGRR
jgi:rhamnosyltransferase